MKTIPGFPDYAITRDGRVWSRARVTSHSHSLPGRWLRPGKHRDGTPRVVLCKQGKHYYRSVHCLVLETYRGPRPAGTMARHLDGDNTNCHLSNLKWGTIEDKGWDSIRLNTIPRGIDSGQARLTETDVREIRERYQHGGISYRQLGTVYDVHFAHIGKIVRREVWSHI